MHKNERNCYPRFMLDNYVNVQKKIRIKSECRNMYKCHNVKYH